MELNQIIAKSSLSKPQIASLRGQAQDLEGVFLNTLVKEMFSGIKTDEKNFGGGFAEDTWRGMQAEQMSSEMSKSGGIGLADQVLGDLIQMQEANQNSNPTMSTKGVYR
jgi:Rod binding domain-containing protein